MDDEAVTRKKKTRQSYFVNTRFWPANHEKKYTPNTLSIQTKEMVDTCTHTRKIEIKSTFLSSSPRKKKKNDFVLFILETEQTTTDL